MTDVVVEARDISLSFGAVQALKGVSFAVPAGKVVGLVGPEGAGKTTLLRLLVGLLTPDAGELTVLGLRLPEQAAELKLQVGYLPERLGLHSHMTVRENLEYFAALTGVPRRELAGRINELLALTALEPFARRLAGQLSGGMKQKLALACAVIHHPRLLVLDEPSTGLDPVFRRDMWELIHDLGTAGAGAIVATPSFEEAARCHYIVALDGGRVLCAGDPQQVTDQAAGRVWQTPATPAAIQAFSQPLPDLRVSRRGQWLRLVATGPQGQSAAAQAAAAAGVPLQETQPTLEDAVLLLKAGVHDGRRPQRKDNTAQGC